MIKIYHVPGTRSIRVIWLCEELGVSYEVVPISFDASFRNSPEWRGKNPVGKVPAMEDGDLTMFESGAMVQYILDRHGDGRLQPRPGTEEHAIYLQWSWFAEATFARPLGEMVNHRREFDPEKPEIISEMQARVRLCVEAVDGAIKDQEYLAGDFTAADVMMGYSLMLSKRLAPWDNLPNAEAYWHRLQAREGYQIAVKAGR